jgi:hypothetical protein
LFLFRDDRDVEGHQVFEAEGGELLHGAFEGFLLLRAGDEAGEVERGADGGADGVGDGGNVVAAGDVGEEEGELDGGEASEQHARELQSQDALG